MLISIKDPENARQPVSILGPQSAEAIPVSSVRRCRFALIMLRSMIVIKNQAGLSRPSFFFRQSNKTNSILQDEKVIDYYQQDRSKKLEQIVHNFKGIGRSPLTNKPTDDGRG